MTADKNETNQDPPKKLCFVVSPIGNPGSATRKRSNGILREIIKPVGQGFGYRIRRADDDKSPGVVTASIVQKLIEAELVVADLHNHNPNVMYEVAIRHALGDPIIQMIPQGEGLPFDIGGLNTIHYDPSFDGAEKWREDLRAAFQAIDGGKHGSNPVTQAGLYRALEGGGFETKDEAVRQSLSLILERLVRLEAAATQSSRSSASLFGSTEPKTPWLPFTYTPDAFAERVQQVLAEMISDHTEVFVKPVRGEDDVLNIHLQIENPNTGTVFRHDMQRGVPYFIEWPGKTGSVERLVAEIQKLELEVSESD